MLAGTARADVPHPWQMWVQTPASPVAERMDSLHILVLWIITVITIFVAGLLAWVTQPAVPEPVGPAPDERYGTREATEMLAV